MKRYLVDTHAVLWWLADDQRLSPAGRAAIADPENDLLISAASIWEIAIKRRLGKLDVPEELPEYLLDEGFAVLPVSGEHGWAVRQLPLHHRDPFDRLLVAQATLEGLPIVTADDRLGRYDGVTVCW